MLFTSIGKDVTVTLSITQGRKDVMETIQHKDIFRNRFAFTTKDVEAHLRIVMDILPELPSTDARHIAEHCYMRYSTATYDNVYESINHFYEVFDITNPLLLGDPSY